MRHRLIHGQALTANGRTLGDNCREAIIRDETVIRPYERPLAPHAGFRVLRGNLFESAIMKTSVITPEFRGSRAARSSSTGRRTITRELTIPLSASTSTAFSS
jgi:dihydroxyacid dehydratase/phosphogluconate dehydratase